jgi:predicted Zn-dependent protease
MSKFRKIEQKIRKNIRKLKKYVIRIGISYPGEIELLNDTPEKLILPCHLGIFFYGDFNSTLFGRIESFLNDIYDSFFFDIRNLGLFSFSKEIYPKGIKKEFKELRKSNKKLSIHPTNKFYQQLIDKRIEENLGMIIVLTDLPIYSSNDVDILFLFGETNLKHRTSIVSTLKLKEGFYSRPYNEDLFFQRLIKEIIHEIGHILLDSNHCKDNSCVMKYSETIEEIDEKTYNFCTNCQGKLDNVRKSSNF